MSERTSITRVFPDSSVSVVHQDGTTLGAPQKGLTVIIHTRPGEQVPCSAEIMSADCDNADGYHAELGLWFDEKDLCDYDGAFDLPLEVAIMLRDLGFTVSEDYFA